MDAIKIFGLPRSGTNIAEFLFKRHFKLPVLTNIPCWKHGENEWDGKPFEVKAGVVTKLHYVICVRNPVRWLWSLHKFENETKRKRQRTPLEFLQEPAWHYKKRTPCEAFNQLIANWLSNCPNHILIKQIESQQSPEQMIKKVADKFGLEIDGIVEPVKTRIHPGCVVRGDLFQNRTVNFEKDHLYLINKSLDQELVRKIGF